MDELSPSSVGTWQAEGVRGLMRSVVMLVLATAMLSCVAIANRSPLPFPDSRAYWIGGTTAVRMAESIAERLLHAGSHKAGAAGQGMVGTRGAVKSAVGVRSVFYSLFVYLVGAAFSLWGIVLAQSLAAAWVVWLLARAIVPDLLRRDYLVIVAALCLFTSLPWITAELMPDVFTGLMIAAVLVLCLRRADLSRGTYALLAAFLAFATATHASHFPLALALLFACLIVAGFETGWPGLASLGARIGSPIALAVAATLAVSMVGFHQLSLTPQSPPFLLARSLADGPGRLLLRSTCPASGWEMCRHLDRIPEKNDDFVWKFIWSPTSLYITSTPQVRDRLRQEELPLALAAARRYPLRQMRASLGNWGAQLIDFAPGEFHLGSDVSVSRGVYVAHLRAPPKAVIADFTVVHYAAMIAALATLIYAFGWAPAIGRRWRQAILLVVVSLLANAAICAVLSEPSPRYQARVAWLVLAVGLVFAADRFRRHSVQTIPERSITAGDLPQA